MPFNWFFGVKPDVNNITATLFEVLICLKSDFTTFDYSGLPPYGYSTISIQDSKIYRMGHTRVNGSNFSARPSRSIKTLRGSIPVTWQVDVNVELLHQWKRGSLFTNWTDLARDEVEQSECVFFVVDPVYFQHMEEKTTLDGYGRPTITVYKVIDGAQMTFHEKNQSGREHVFSAKISKRGMIHPFSGFQTATVTVTT